MRHKQKPMTLDEARRIGAQLADGSMDPSHPLAWVSQTDVAALLMVSRHTVQRMAKRGRLPMSRRGTERGFFVPLGAVLAILDSGVSHVVD